MKEGERRRSARTTVTGIFVSVKKQGFLGKKIDNHAEILDMSSTGLGITLRAPLDKDTTYLLGFKLQWLKTTRYMTVKAVNCVEIDTNLYRAGLRVIQDEHSTLSFISTAIVERQRKEKE